MSFRFNFSNMNDCTSTSYDNKISFANKHAFIDENDVSELQPDFLSLDNIDCKDTSKDISLLQIGNLEVKYVLVKSIQIRTESETFSEVDALKTDIIPGKYEGGLKIWECSLDLAIYLAENQCINEEDDVLELGCGAGIPGIVAYLNGANVTFQDFNPEVLKLVTLPNTILNSSEEQLHILSNKCQYLHGDWDSIRKKYYTEIGSGKKYDVIVTSETIYEKSNSRKLLHLMKAALKPDGIIYLAAKIHYFGVGGGIVDFEMLVKEDGTFQISPVLKIADGVERQILKLTFLKS